MPVITRKTLAMKIEIIKGCSLEAKKPTGVFRFGELIASVELWLSEGGSTASWWVSGPNKDDALSMLFQAQVLVSAESQNELEDELLDFASIHAFPLASSASMNSLGFKGFMEERLPEDRSGLFLNHVDFRFTDHLRSNLTPVKQTVMQFQLATSLGLGTPLRDIAKFQGLSPMTIETRITRARKSGELPKATLSSAADIKELN
jgi:hypothetical protein